MPLPGSVPLAADRLNDGTAFGVSLLAFGQQMCERSFESSKIFDARANLFQSFSCYRPHTASVGAVLELEQRFDLFETEAQRLCSLHKPYSFNLLVAVATIAAIARRLPDQAAAFVEAHGLDADTCRFGRSRDGYARMFHSTP